jgi:hypothetical protein
VNLLRQFVEKIECRNAKHTAARNRCALAMQAIDKLRQIFAAYRDRL